MQLFPFYTKQTQQSKEGIADFRRTKISSKCQFWSLTPKPVWDKTGLCHHRNSTIAHQVFVWRQEGSIVGEDTLNDKRKTKMCCNILLNTWRNCSSKHFSDTVLQQNVSVILMSESHQNLICRRRIRNRVFFCFVFLNLMHFLPPWLRAAVIFPATGLLGERKRENYLHVSVSVSIHRWVIKQLSSGNRKIDQQ